MAVRGCFPFNEKFWFEFPEISCAKWSSIFRNFQKRDIYLARYTKVLRNFLPGISIPFDFPSGISGIFV